MSFWRGVGFALIAFAVDWDLFGAIAVDVPRAAVRSRTGPILMRSIAVLALSLENSVPIKWRPIAVATTAVVPDPRKGSRIVSPSLEVEAMTRWR